MRFQFFLWIFGCETYFLLFQHFFYRKWYFSFEYKQCRLQSKLLNYRTRQLVRPLPFPFEWIISGRCLWSDFAKPVDILVAGNMYEVWWRKLVETFHWSSTCHIIKKPYLCYDRVAINSSCSHIFFFFYWSQWNIFLKLGIRWCCRFNVWYYQLRLQLMNKTHKQCLNHPQLQQTSPSWLEWFLWSIFNDLITMFVWMIIFTQTETVATKWKWFSNNQSQLHIYYHQLYAFTIITIGIIITIIIICITFIIIIISKWGKSCWRIQFVRSHLPRFLFECNQKWFNASCIHFDFDSIKK